MQPLILRKLWRKATPSTSNLVMRVSSAGGQVGGEGNCPGLIRLCLFPLDANQPDSQVGSIPCESEDYPPRALCLRDLRNENFSAVVKSRHT